MTAKKRSGFKSTGKRRKTANALGSSRVTAGVKPQKVTRRIVNSKRHTIGYVVGGRSYSMENNKQLRSLLSMARNGGISGVRAVGNHIQAIPGRKRLSTLPRTIEKS